MTPGPGIEPRPHWWEASALTTAPPLLPNTHQGENQQQTQLTYDAGSTNRTQATLVGGERSHHCAIPAPQYTSRREPTTNSTHIWRRVRESNPGHTGGRRALSPLHHPCSQKDLKKGKGLSQMIQFSFSDEASHNLAPNLEMESGEVSNFDWALNV